MKKNSILSKGLLSSWLFYGQPVAKRKPSPELQAELREKAQAKRERKAKARYWNYHFSIKHNPCLAKTGKNFLTREYAK
jgi:hypothetical protein